MSSVSQLADYKAQNLDISAEIENLRQSLEALRKRPSVGSTLELCMASRRMLYALDELAWNLGRHDPAFVSRYQETLALFEEALRLEQPTLDSCSDENSRQRLRIFFQGIQERQREILRTAENI